MQICQRCRADQAVTNAAGIGLCSTCARTLRIADRDGPPSAVGASAGGYAGGNPYQQPPLHAGTEGSGSSTGTPTGSSTSWPVDPFAMGQSAGRAAAASPSWSGAVTRAAEAARQGASTLETVAILGAILGVAVVGYAVYKAHRASERATTIVTEHPEVAKALIAAA